MSSPDAVAPAMTLAALLVVTTVTAATSGGVLFAFSSFIMPGLARLEPSAGVATMQSINVTALRPAFMAVFFGAGVLHVLTAVVAVTERFPGSPLVVTAAVLYLVGVIAVTAGVNVPLNNRLAAAAADEAVRSGLWAQYQRRWTAANHVRSLASALSAALVVVAAVAA